MRRGEALHIWVPRWFPPCPEPHSKDNDLDSAAYTSSVRRVADPSWELPAFAMRAGARTAAIRVCSAIAPCL